MKIIDTEIQYRSRDPKTLALTQAEADQMIREGFRFADYDKHKSSFTLEPPWEFGRDDAKGLWIIRQVTVD